MKQIKEIGLRFDLVANVKDKNIKDLEIRAEKLARHYEKVIKKTNKIREGLDRARNSQRSLNTISVQYGKILSKNLDLIQKISKATKSIKPISVKTVSVNPKATKESVSSDTTTNSLKSHIGDDKIYANALEMNKKYDTKKMEDYTKLFDMAIKAEEDAITKKTNHYNKLFDEADQRERDAIKKRISEHGVALEMNKKFNAKKIADYTKIFDQAIKAEDDAIAKKISEHGKALEMNKKFDAKKIADYTRLFDKAIKAEDKKRMELAKSLSGQPEEKLETMTERLANKFSMLEHAASLVERTFNSLMNVGEKLAGAETLRRQGEALEKKFGNVFDEEIKMLGEREGLTKSQVLGEVGIIMGRYKTRGLNDEKSVELTKETFKAARYIVATRRDKTIAQALDSMTNIIDGVPTALDQVGIDLSKKEAEKGATDPMQAMWNRIFSVTGYLEKNPLVKLAEETGTLSQAFNKTKNIYTAFISRIEEQFNPVFTSILEGINKFFYRFISDPILMDAIGRFAKTIDLVIKGFNKIYWALRPLFYVFEKMLYVTVLVKSFKMVVFALDKVKDYFLSFGGLFKIGKSTKMGIPVRVVNAEEMGGSTGGTRGILGEYAMLGGKSILRKIVPLLTKIGPMVATAASAALPFLPAILAVAASGYLLWKMINYKPEEEKKKENEAKAKTITSFKFVDTDLKAQSLERYKKGVSERFNQDLGIIGQKSKESLSGKNNTSVTIENNVTVTGAENPDGTATNILGELRDKVSRQLNDSTAMGGV